MVWSVRVIYFIVAILVSYLVFKYGVTPGLKWLRSDTTVGMSTRPWTDKIILADEMVVDTPFKLTPTELRIPEEKRELISDLRSYFGKRKDVSVLTAMFSYHPGVTLNLDAAVDGALESMRAVPGTKSVDSVKRDTMALGDGGIEMEARITQNGEPLEMHGIFILRQRRLYQLIFVAPVKHKERTATWERMKSSVRFVSPPKQSDGAKDPTGLPAKPPKGGESLPAGMRRRTGAGAKPPLDAVGR